MNGWEIRAFTNLFDIQGGTQPPKSTFTYAPTPGYVQLLQIRDFGDKPVPTYVLQSRKLNQCEQSNLLIGRYGASVGRICTGQKGAYNVALAKVRIPAEIDRKYVYYLLLSDLFQAPVKEIERSAQNGFNQEDLSRIFLPIAPLPEQHRIVAKLDALLSRVNASRQRLNKIPKLLARFRQSVLAAACSGPEDDANKEQRTCLGDVLFDKPQNGIYKPQSEYGSGSPIVRIENFYDGVIQDLPNLKRLRISASEIESFGLRKGDLLINRVNSMSFLGKCALVPQTDEPVVFESNMMRIRLNLSQAMPEYVTLCLRSPNGLAELRKNAKHAVNQSSINQDDVRAVEIYLPPLPEQQEIVRRVDQLFAFADRLEARVATARKRVDALTQSILAKAFRGELVPTEAELARAEGRSFESAAELLARIESLNGQGPVKQSRNPRRRKSKG